MDQERFQSILSRVQKPGKYLGNEINVIKKDFDKAEVRVALVFPDKYEIGMSHIGLKILYDILNKLPHVVAERCYAPDLDMEAELRAENLPLFSLESKRPLYEFDLIGVSLTYELTYTNLVNILDLGGIPVWQKDRQDHHPIVLGGGGCMMNAEPMADFLDAAALGDGEEIILDVVEAVRRWKRGTVDVGRGTVDVAQDFSPARERKKLLDCLSEIEGIYVPSFFEPLYNADGTIKEIKSLKEGYTHVKKRVLKEIDQAPYPTKLIVPSVKLVHDRVGIEIQRGCNRACRFCQAGYIDRPVRQRSPETVLNLADKSLQQTGMEQVSLLSLSAADYACIIPLMAELNARYADNKVAISVPATRTEKLTPELAEQIKQVRKTGFTIAPEAGSARMRRVINKGNKVDDLYRAMRTAFSKGWNILKLYYMVGLPFEEEEDIRGIAEEGNESIKICLEYTRRAEINLSLSSFVPKPHTPFQWEPQMTLEETRKRYGVVRRHLKNRRIRLKHHNSEMSYIEGLFSRGDRRLSSLIYLAYKEGCRFDEWGEHFDWTRWQEVLEKWGGDVDFYLHRRRLRDEILPWDHLFAQMDKNFLWDEYLKAKEASLAGGRQTTDDSRQLKSEKNHRLSTNDCRLDDDHLRSFKKRLKSLPNQLPGFTEDCSTDRCSNCGVCDFKGVKNRLYVVSDRPLEARKGHREWYGWNSSLVARLSASSLEDRSPLVKKDDSPATSYPAKQLALQKTGGQAGKQFLEEKSRLPATGDRLPATPFKVRFRYTKIGLARLMGHLELMGVLKRALRRAGLPVCYSEGFHPQMKISMSPPLTLGVESEWEFFDLELQAPKDPESLLNLINKELPEGMNLLEANMIDRKSPSLYASFEGADFEASFQSELIGPQWLVKARSALLKFNEASEFFWTRKTPRGPKQINLKEMIAVSREDLPKSFYFRTRIKPEGSIKPQEVLEALFGLTRKELSRVRLKKINSNFKT